MWDYILLVMMSITPKKRLLVSPTLYLLYWGGGWERVWEL